MLRTRVSVSERRQHGGVEEQLVTVRRSDRGHGRGGGGEVGNVGGGGEEEGRTADAIGKGGGGAGGAAADGGGGGGGESPLLGIIIACMGPAWDRGEGVSEEPRGEGGEQGWEGPESPGFEHPNGNWDGSPPPPPPPPAADVLRGEMAEMAAEIASFGMQAVICNSCSAGSGDRGWGQVRGSVRRGAEDGLGSGGGREKGVGGRGADCWGPCPMQGGGDVGGDSTGWALGAQASSASYCFAIVMLLRCYCVAIVLLESLLMCCYCVGAGE